MHVQHEQVPSAFIVGPQAPVHYHVASSSGSGGKPAQWPRTTP